jgi:hypothetical protein
MIVYQSAIFEKEEIVVNEDLSNYVISIENNQTVNFGYEYPLDSHKLSIEI